ncbi:MobA/MobL family protein [Leptotrichia sp.]|jgi:mobA/mobL protein|uniref:MobA/MobL family protein n=1 Tax=Leptotrichia sp. TaxID=104608 RepID=UPI0017D71597|nr:MobA/MobL family protein [Leptotrichia sp.]MBB1534207.1 MobA/MobL family protein [Leptotrichia sp.]
MAIYHFYSPLPSKITTPALDKHDYDNREGRFSKLKDLYKKETFNLPEEFKDVKEFWKMGELYGRINGRPYLIYEFALPREFSDEKNWEIGTGFLKQHFGDKFVYNVSMHNDKGDSPHMHVMFYTGELDGIKRNKISYFKNFISKNPKKGGLHKRGDKFSSEGGDVLRATRKEFADYLNVYLEQAGIEKVSSESLEDQREKVLEEGDLLKAEMLDREAVYIDGNVLKRLKKGELIDGDKEKLEEFEEKKRIKKLKEKVYALKKELNQKLEEYEKYKEANKKYSDYFEEINNIDMKIYKNEQKLKTVENSVFNKMTNGEFSKSLMEISEINKRLKKSKEQKDIIAKDRLIKKLNELKKGILEDDSKKEEFDKLKNQFEMNYKKSNDNLINKKNKIIIKLKEKGINFENDEEGSINYLLLLYDNSKIKFEEYMKYAENKINELEKELNEDWNEKVLDEITRGEYSKIKKRCEKLNEELTNEEEKLGRIKSNFFNFKKRKEAQKAFDKKKDEFEKLSKVKKNLEKEIKKDYFKNKKSTSKLEKREQLNKFRLVKNNGKIVQEIFNMWNVSRNLDSMNLRENQKEEERYEDLERD